MKLWISSTAPDTDFTAKLIDEIPPNADYPLGFDLNIGDSILRARYREGLDHQAAPLRPGQVVPVTITLYPTANVFKKGHRIRVDISSSNYPRFDVNPNTGDPLGEHRRMVPADNTVHHDASHPSRVILPVIPRRERRPGRTGRRRHLDWGRQLQRLADDLHLQLDGPFRAVDHAGDFGVGVALQPPHEDLLERLGELQEQAVELLARDGGFLRREPPSVVSPPPSSSRGGDRKIPAIPAVARA